MSDTETQPPHSELATFGEELRREREIRGISLKEIADATKISRRFLDAIERNDHKTLPAPVFTRGFVREYARYLGLNAEEVVNRYNYAAAGDDRIEKSAHLDRLVPDRSLENERKPAHSRGLPSPFARVDRGIYVLLFLVAALIGAIYWTVRHRHAAASNDAAEVQRDSSSKPLASVPVTTASAPQTSSAPAATPTPVPDGLLHLSMTFTDDSWISLEVDHQTYNFDARKGARRNFDAKERFRFRTIGNAAGVEMTLNDVRIPPLGREGEVLHDRVFDRDYFQKAQLMSGHQ
jgi:cytoskeleton protein RodZ